MTPTTFHPKSRGSGDLFRSFLPLAQPGSLWKIFGLLVLANTALAFLPAGLGVKALLGALFIVVPLFWLVGLGPLTDRQTRPIWNMDLVPAPSLTVWALVAAFALASRFTGLAGLSNWPTMDEDGTGFTSLRLFEKWDGSLLLGDIQMPPSYFWGQALFFHLFGPSLLSFWLFPAVVSILTLGLGYWAARAFFPPAFSFLCLGFGALNYWWIWAGRLSEPIILVVPLECLAFGVWGRLLKAQGRNHLGIWPGVFGIVTGLCLYTSTLSLFLAAFLGILVLERGWSFPRDRKALYSGFTLGFMVALPLILAAVFHRYGRYPASLWFWKDSGYYENHWMAPLSHVTALFWGARDWTFWGGFLNPLEGALVFLGLAFCLKNPRSSPAKGLLAAFGFFLLPGLLTNNFEPFRSFLVSPLLLVFAVLGWGWLLSGIPGKTWGRVAATAALSALCAGLNLYHLWGPYHQAWGEQGPLSSRFKDVELWRAYDQLEEIQKTQGPGFIYPGFDPLSGRSLRLAVYPFNADENPGERDFPARWFAVLTNAQFTPFLAKRFPGSRWIWLSEHLPAAHGGLELGVIPCSAANPVPPSWPKAHSVLKDVDLLLDEGLPSDSAGRALEVLQSNRADFEGDPFLQSVYWDKLQGLYAAQGKIAEAVEALRQAAHSGYPVASVYQWMAYRLKQENQDQQAEEAYQKAVQLAGHPPPGGSTP